MRSSFGRIHDGVTATLEPEARVPASATGAREIPYDHVATFTLLGQRGNRVKDVINVSIDGTFVAVASATASSHAVAGCRAPAAQQNHVALPRQRRRSCTGC